MIDWNVVITIHEGNFPEAMALLGEFGKVYKTEYFNVAAMKVEDRLYLMEQLRIRVFSAPELLTVLARVVPAEHTFNFQTPEDFEARAGEIILRWAPRLTGKKFHVRMHRRGFKGRLSSMQEEKFLDSILLAALNQTESPGSIDFDNPDIIISVETIGQRAGLSLWTSEDIKRYTFLGVD